MGLENLLKIGKHFGQRILPLILASSVLFYSCKGPSTPYIPPETNNPGNTNPIEPPPNFEEKILFVSNIDGNPEIYMMNTSGTNQTRLTNNNFEDAFPS